jgi:hypothetical protein
MKPFEVDAKFMYNYVSIISEFANVKPTDLIQHDNSLFIIPKVKRLFLVAGRKIEETTLNTLPPSVAKDIIDFYGWD